MIRTRSYEERRAAAYDVLVGTRGGGVDAEPAYDEVVEQLGPYGQYALDFVFGDVWSRPGLSRRDRSMITIAMTTTLGAERQLIAHTETGYHHGLTRVEIEEIILHTGAYGGFPMAGTGWQVTAAVLDRLEGVTGGHSRWNTEQKDDETRRRDGFDVLKSLYGDGAPWADPDAAADALFEANGPMGQLALDFVLGDIWTRPGLSRRDRSLITVAICALVAPTTLDHHVPGALNHGVTRDELMEVTLQVSAYGGWQRGALAVQEVRRAFAALDGPGEAFDLLEPVRPGE